ncbi:MAG: aminotransferase class III-fold pyridoxal phosphate-dependent enzyme [Rhodospirillales bacterium]|nr:aminotransferase class III-fold pyridoxal phosphate-dependent enzyme [Rhodospirillales bacterium]
MKKIAIIQARMQSTRLPGKVMADLGGRPMIAWTLSAARRIRGLDTVVVATSDNTADDGIATWCEANHASCYRGPRDDVLERFHRVAVAEDADVIMRLTADCPFLDPHICELVLGLFDESGVDYASNIDPPTWPDGLDCEVFSRSALQSAAKNARAPADREHVTPYIRNRRNLFRMANVRCPIPGLHRLRWTVDEAADLAFARDVADRLGGTEVPSHLEILALLRDAPDTADINMGIRRNQGAEKTRRQWPDGHRGYEQSNLMLERAERVIPLASQTFSKSHLAYPAGCAPLFLEGGDGCRVVDVDGNEYIDFVNGLLPVILGYSDPDVDGAVIDRIGKGVTLSLATRLEMELAELLAEVVPCAEMARFGKNGSDATAGAVRLARAYTNRDRVAVCGYHGWQDWYIGSTSRNRGVPKAVSELTHPFPYNDLEALDRLLSSRPGEFACVIMEAMNATEPAPGYLEGVRDLAHDHGALFVLDEIITGFRYALGGAQEYFGVTPDLATLGKGMGNGYAISAIVGRADIMHLMEEIFFSFTAGGETVGLAAALATIGKIRDHDVVEHLWDVGGRVQAGLRPRLEAHGLGEWVSLNGLAPWTLLTFKDSERHTQWQKYTLFIQEMLRRGILIQSSHNISLAHTASEADILLDAYDEVLPAIADAVFNDSMDEKLSGAPIEPLFRVR